MVPCHWELLHLFGNRLSVPIRERALLLLGRLKPRVSMKRAVVEVPR